MSKTLTLRKDFGKLKKEIEHFLLTRFNVIVTYDIYDAFHRLQEEGLMIEEGNGKIRAKSPQEATRILDENWARYFAKYRVI